MNIPYDDRYTDLYLAFIAGLTSFGLDPRASLEVPGGERRLDRIYSLITSCKYSFHDLSRVQLDRRRPQTPRFNMPFELGLVLGWLKTSKSDHTWFLFESVERRISKSLSDLDGTDAYIHGETPKGLFRQLGNALVRGDDQPTVEQMFRVYRKIKTASPLIVKRAGAKSLYEARVFRELVVLARSYVGLGRTVKG